MMSIELLVDALEETIDRMCNVAPLTNGEIIAALETIKLDTYMQAKQEIK